MSTQYMNIIRLNYFGSILKEGIIKEVSFAIKA